MAVSLVTGGGRTATVVEMGPYVVTTPVLGAVCDNHEQTR